ncbi:sigma-54 interaction domain-containing protein [Derxia lacustris]|uniref:sigma-54 interaction domain-containing protein n=1 Tax=Derxia lacustris TaxID=764842 RepID=UPI000A17137F|nr:sigma-54 dependent transcriptional regulator [Derxia lacustris]
MENLALPPFTIPHWHAESRPVLTLPEVVATARPIKASAQIFEDAKSLALLERIRMIAPSNANALIIGETGTGKELIARHIHALSARNQGPFLAVNCGALSETLVESELFGHEKGAFTGAFAAKAGWFEAANGGTLFLDEVGDLPLHLQVKLLRVLQEREVVRLGARRPVPIDVRLIAATNTDLERAVCAGQFREDLYYRLRVAHLALPALRERRGDILPLARYFIDEYGRRMNYGETRLAAEAESVLLAHDWPGNIRELENVIHHALLICHDNVIGRDDISLSSLQRPQSQAEGVDKPAAALDRLEEALRALYEEMPADLYKLIEKSVIRSAYEFCHHNQVQSAKLLGVSRNIVRARLIEFGEIDALK